MEKHSDITKMVQSFIDKEKETEPNPFLATRIMASIESRKRETTSMRWFVLKPVLAIASLVLVVWLGINAGSAWTSEVPVGATLENDSRTENLVFYSQLDKE